MPIICKPTLTLEGDNIEFLGRNTFGFIAILKQI